jgi:hypothetical protein
MARAIDADGMKNSIREWQKSLTDFRTLEEVVDGQPTIEPKQEWISVRDRLPEEGVQVLVYWDDGFEIGRYVGGEVGDGVYWMPLPEPPEMNREEEQE